jgi:hypothetical protein
MVRPPLSFLEDSLSADKTNTSLSSESGEFTVTSNASPLGHTATDIQTELSSNRNSYVEQYVNIYYKKILDQSVSDY